MIKNILKNTLYTVALAGLAAFVIYAARTGFEKQARIDCLNAARICENFRDVHKGKCTECRIVDYCIKENLL